MPETLDVMLGEGAGAFPGVSAAPAGSPAGGIVVLQEAFGLTGHIRNVCGRLPGARLPALPPAPVSPAGCARPRLRRVLQRAPVDGPPARGGNHERRHGRARLSPASGMPADRCAAVGFCMGGSVAFIMATEFELGAAVTFYGGGVAQGRFGFPALADAAPSLRAPWLGLYGD